LEQVIPKNLEAEQALLSCLCIEGTTDAYDSISSTVKKEDFYEYKNGLVFNAISSLASKGEAIDSISICEELKQFGSLDEVGGAIEVMARTDKVQTATSTKYFANIVQEKSKLREMIRSFRIGVEDALAENKKASEISGAVQNKLIELEVGSDDKTPVKTSVNALRGDFKDMLNGEYQHQAIETHIRHLDEKLGCRGIGLGEVLVIAAPTSCGKSQLALNICARNISRNNLPCGIVSLEMPQKQIIKRMTGCISGVQIAQIQDQVVRDEDMDKVNDALEQIEGAPLFTIHSVKNINDLTAKIRAMHRRHKVELVVIDYLQLIPFNSANSKAEAVSDMSHKIKQLALDLNIAIVLLSQVNREGSRSQEGLELYHLRDSGDIENDADVILLMWPFNTDLADSKRSDATGTYALMQYKIAKNREGERDLKGQFKFFNQFGRFF
tara:strand:+ start:2292 stop:3611 length:1320 start_codon:yes stop_codon:yes gene_type:complete